MHEILQFHCPIAINGSRIAWAAGNCLVVYNFETRKFEKSLGEKSSHTDSIRAIAFSSDGSEIATAGEDKRVVVTTGQEFLHGKKIMAVHIDESGIVVFGDKFGDFYRLQKGANSDNPIADDTDSVDSEDETTNNKQLELLFGHISAISTSLYSPKRKLLISADRDEKIRIARYPRADIIESFLLKHRRYVSHLTWGNEAETVLVSAGADGQIIEWDVSNPGLATVIEAHGVDVVGFHSITSDCAGRIFFVAVDDAKKIRVISSESIEWIFPFEIQAIKSYQFGGKIVLIAIDANSHMHVIDSTSGIVLESVTLPSDVPGVPISYLKLVHHENLQGDERDSKRNKTGDTDS